MTTSQRETLESVLSHLTEIKLACVGSDDDWLADYMAAAESIVHGALTFSIERLLRESDKIPGTKV